MDGLHISLHYFYDIVSLLFLQLKPINYRNYIYISLYSVILWDETKLAFLLFVIFILVYCLTFIRR